MRGAGLLVLVLTVSSAAAAAPDGKSIPLPDGSGGIGLDDMAWAPSLGRVVVPAGRTGRIVLIDPAGGPAAEIGGFRVSPAGNGHGEGTTSADEGPGLLFASDRTAGELVAIDEKERKIVSRAKLAGGPDYVRWVEATHEVWVTEPEGETIEIFRLGAGFPPALEHSGFVSVPGGPESLVVDGARGRAYANLWKEETVAIDLKTRAIAARWKNGCGGARGLALDRRRGFLFAACTEGRVVSLELESGKTLSSVAAPNGIDIIDYNPSRGHLYVPGAKDAQLAVVAVSPSGGLTALGRYPTAPRAHCVAAEPGGGIYVCDPPHGAVISLRDTFPAEKP
jgi:sugar lactone lactonase YvrE